MIIQIRQEFGKGKEISSTSSSYDRVRADQVLLDLDVLPELLMVTPVTVMALLTIMPAAGMTYLGVNGKTSSTRSRVMVITVPTRMDTKAMCFPRGTCFARLPAV